MFSVFFNNLLTLFLLYFQVFAVSLQYKQNGVLTNQIFMSMELNEYLEFLDKLLEVELKRHRLYRKVALHFGKRVDVIYYPHTNTLAFNEDIDGYKVSIDEVQGFVEHTDGLDCKVSIMQDGAEKHTYIKV